MNLQLKIKFGIASVRLILTKVRDHGLTGPYRKVTSDKKTIFSPYQRYKGGNRIFCSHFSVIFEITSKFLIISVRLIFGKVRFDGFTEPRWEFDIRYEFCLKVNLYGLGCK